MMFAHRLGLHLKELNDRKLAECSRCFNQKTLHTGRDRKLHQKMPQKQIHENVSKGRRRGFGLHLLLLVLEQQSLISSCCHIVCFLKNPLRFSLFLVDGLFLVSRVQES